ncbi:MAG: 2-phospho-L-lactate guanylyltransferase [Ilumatobacteraceae bacterium]
MRVAVVIPVKSFGLAKGRLAGALNPSEREALSRDCAERVVASASPWPVLIVCDDENVAEWARSVGAQPVDCRTPGLDAAVDAGRRAASANGATHVVIAHADLPLANSLSHVPRKGRVTIVPDRHRDGTNILSMPVDCPMHTAYGPGSFDNHVALARTAGFECDIIDDPDLALDLDTVDDLAELDRRTTS